MLKHGRCKFTDNDRSHITALNPEQSQCSGITHSLFITVSTIKYLYLIPSIYTLQSTGSFCTCNTDNWATAEPRYIYDFCHYTPVNIPNARETQTFLLCLPWSNIHAYVWQSRRRTIHSSNLSHLYAGCSEIKRQQISDIQLPQFPSTHNTAAHTHMCFYQPFFHFYSHGCKTLHQSPTGIKRAH